MLGKRAELASQEIYFASPGELNDPMEGFKNLFWKGDEIVWRNLIRHYVLCLFNTVMTVIFLGADFDKSRHANFVHHTAAELPNDTIRKIYADICEKLFAYEVVRTLVAMLASSSAKVRRDELTFYLRALNPLVFTLVKGALAIPPTDVAVDSVGHSTAMDQLKSMSTMQMALIHDINNDLTPLQKAWRFIARDFDDFYVGSLESLVHPAWYAACFVDDASNASMWGSYGDGHKGICLKFAADTDTAGHSSLRLCQAIGIGGGKENVRIHYGYGPLPFEIVQYGEDYPEISFFETLGAIPMGRLGAWYAGADGQRSSASTRVLENQDDWRKGYWRDYYASRVTKTRDWEHEQEYRLVLGSSITQPRCLKYQFKDLVGVCFGIKTPPEDKVRVMQIIEEKCIAERRTDSSFIRHASHTGPRRLKWFCFAC